jgi:hypothetical protein
MIAKPIRKLKASLSEQLRWTALPLARFVTKAYASEMERLQAYAGLVHQSYHGQFFQPWLSTDAFWKGEWHHPSVLPPTKSPAQRERDNAVHHYGHDVLLKRYAELPLVGRPLPFLLEHGVNFSDQSRFELPKPWVRTYLTMGEHRAGLLRSKHELKAIAIGPYLRYARSPVTDKRFRELKQQLGKTLLTIPAHSTAQVKRVWSAGEWISIVERHRREHGYEHVLWMGFWNDAIDLDQFPPGWIAACNGHASNPWFLDCQRLLFALSDAVCTFSLGTHVGYALELGLPVLLARQSLQQDMSRTDPVWRDRFQGELEERERIMDRLFFDAEGSLMPRLNRQSAMAVLDPWFGFSQQVSKEGMAALLRG